MIKRLKMFVQFLEDLKLFKQYIELKDDFDTWFDIACNEAISNDINIPLKEMLDYKRKYENSIAHLDTLVTTGIKMDPRKVQRIITKYAKSARIDGVK